MIQNKTAADRSVQGNLQGEDIQMGVSDMAHILNVLTDLYADREMACIREYSTNAVDAHIEAGVTAPIEVQTPTHLSPFLIIRDFGIGLSLDDIRAIYSQYGASTKRNTNTQTGMLGLGSKSAMTYADQFTVTSVKDGVRLQVVVSRNTMGASMKVVDTSDTTEPNGTTVTIPARSGNSIEAKAKRFFSHWPAGKVKLNGREPEFMPGAQKVTDSIYIVDAHQNVVVMGGVPYPAPNLRDGLGYGQSLVAFVDIGSVDFAPNREALMDTDTTLATLRKVETEFRAALAKSVQDDINAAPTPREAIQRRMNWRQKLPGQLMPATLTYKGKQVPNEQPVPVGTIIAPVNGRKMTSHSTMQRGIAMETVLQAIWIVGWDHASFTATTKKKLLKYCEDNSLTPMHFILSNQPPSKDWIADLTFVDWDDIKSIKLPRNAPNPRTGRIPGSYDIYEDGDYNEGVPGDDIDTSNEVFWMFGRYYEGRTMAQWLKQSYPGSTLVMLRSGREAKFQRNFPKAKNAENVLRQAFDAWAKKIPNDQRVAYACQNDYSPADLDVLDVSKVDDPEVKHAVKVRKMDVSGLEAKVQEWSKLGMYYDPSDRTDNPLRKYTLLPDLRYGTRRGRLDMEHIYRYMNNEFLFQTQQAAAKAAKP